MLIGPISGIHKNVFDHADLRPRPRWGLTGYEGWKDGRGMKEERKEE